MHIVNQCFNINMINKVIYLIIQLEILYQKYFMINNH